jgi:hypothetical protein
MTKFSARFDGKTAKDAKASKDAKGKGKANPPNSPSQGGVAAAAGSNPGAGVKVASTARGSPLGGKTSAASGAQKGGEIHQNKRPWVTRDKIHSLLVPFLT